MVKISGIYSIINTVNGKYYIGKSNNIYRRWYDEKLGLKNGTFHNVHIQRAWNLYGADAFKFGIIEECEEDMLAEREKFWISYFDCYDNGYNQTLGGEGSVGAVCSDEKKEKLRLSHLGERNARSRPVYCVELDMSFWGAKAAQDTLGAQYKVSKGGVTKCCNGTGVSSGRLPNGQPLHWCYLEDKDKFIMPISVKDVPIYCNELGEYFASFKVAENDGRIFNVYHSTLKMCCDGHPQHITCGRLEDGTKLTWRYLTEPEINALFRLIA